MSHIIGDHLNCSMKCFDLVPEKTRNDILKNFNLMESVNIQNSYLCDIVSVIPVQRRRLRKDEAEARFDNEFYKCRDRCSIENGVKEVTVLSLIHI